MIKHLRVTVDGKSYDVTVEELGQSATAPATPVAIDPLPSPAAAAPAASAAAPASAGPAAGGPNDRTAPLGGIVVEILVAVGDSVVVDQPVVLLEAMKMRTVIGAHKAGRVTAIYVGVGNGVDVDQPLLSID
jgi:biotin carboxyl carrier protein